MPRISCQELTSRQSGISHLQAGWLVGQAGVVSAPQLGHDNHVNLTYSTLGLLCIVGALNIVYHARTVS